MQGIASLPMDMAPEGAPSGDSGMIGSLTAQEASTLGRLLTKVSQDEIDQLRELSEDLKEFSGPELRDFLGGVDYIMANAQNYKQSVRNLIARGIVEPGDLPADYVPTFYSILRQMLVDALKEVEQAPAADVQAFAKGGLATMAKKVAAAGRDGDTMLAHITPHEARVLKSMGGAGTINPKTGLVEYKSFWSKVGNFLKKAAPVILPVALNFLLPGAGAAIGGALGFSGAMAGSVGSAIVGAVGSGVGGLIAGQKPGQALLSAALGGLGSFALSGGFTGGEGISGLFSGGGTGAQAATNAASFQAGAGGVNPTVGVDASGATSSAADAVRVAVPTPVPRPTDLAAVTTPATNAGLSGGLGGLFGKVGNFVQQNPMTALALAGGAGLLLGGSGQQEAAAPTGFGPTGVDLLRQNPEIYGFDINKFKPRSTYAGGVVPTASPITAKAGGHIAGPGTGTSDSIPALLSDGEFVLTAKAVRGAGDGSRIKGAKRLYKLMNSLERRA